MESERVERIAEHRRLFHNKRQGKVELEAKVQRGPYTAVNGGFEEKTFVYKQVYVLFFSNGNGNNTRVRSAQKNVRIIQLKMSPEQCIQWRNIGMYSDTYCNQAANMCKNNLHYSV